MASTPNSDDGGGGPASSPSGPSASSPRDPLTTEPDEPLTPPTTTTPVVASNHSHYDDLRAAHAGSFLRKGNVDVLPAAAAAHPDDEYDKGEGEGDGEVALCHLTAMWRYSTLSENPDTGQLAPISLGPGFYGDSSSVLMAIHHFNNGMGAVVDEVEGINERCNLRFTAEFFDTYSSLPRTVETITELMNRDVGAAASSGPQQPRPCAVLGAFRSAVSTPLAILTGVYDLPQISPVSSSPDLDNTDLFPLFSRLVPSDAGTSLLTAKYFLEMGVTHVGVIFVNDAYGSAFQRAFKRIGESLGLTVDSYSIGFKPTRQEIADAISGLKATRYRYFFGIIFGPEHYDLVMEEAYRQGIAGRPDEMHTFWIFGGGVQRYVQNARYKVGSALARATQGAAMIQADGGIEGMTGFDRYLKAWRALDEDDVAYFNMKQPEGEDYFVADGPEYFARNDPERESVFAYDAVTALGLAACKLLENDTDNDGAYFGGKELFEEFVRTSFVGASGTVVIDPETTSRDPQSALYVIFNAVADEPDEDDLVSFAVHPAVVHLSEGDGWQSVRGSPFVFNDGTLTRPAPLPHLSVNMNYIGTGLRAFGLVLSGIVLLTSIGFTVWIFRHKDLRIVRASQPIFLAVICVGCFFMSSSIIPLSIDDQVATVRGCDAACMAVPWLYTIGFALAYAALFSKTWRINMLLTNRTIRRVRVSVSDVMRPFAFLVAANVLVLSLWTALSPLRWRREFTGGKDEFGRSIESYGGCMVGGNLEHLPYILTLIVINGAVLVFLNFQAYRARDIRTEFSESRYIGIAMGSILQAWVIGIPLMFVVVGDPQAQYLVLVCIITVGSMAILYLIMIPKFFMRKRRRGNNKGRRSSMQSGLDAIDAVEERPSHVFVSGLVAPPGRTHSAPNICIHTPETAENFGEEGMGDDNESHGDRSNSSGFGGVAIVPHVAEQRNAFLYMSLTKLKKDKGKMLQEMKALLEKTDEGADQTVVEDDMRKLIWRYDDDVVIRGT